MQYFKITIQILQYWHCGTGSGGEGDVDATPMIEPSGLPIIPGKHLKGLLREAARCAVHEGFIESDPELESRWFGLRDDREKQNEGRIRVANARLQDAFANYARDFHAETGHSCPEAVALFETLRQTALEKGVAKNHSLRSIRCTVPVTMEAEIELDAAEGEAAEKLKLLCKLIRAVGHGRNDGLGRCVVTCKTVEDKPENHAGVVESDFLSRLVEITLKDDVIVSASNASAGGHRCLDYIPGSVLLGIAAASKYADLKKQNRAIAVFQSGAVSFGPAYPVSHGAKTPAIPVPASWHVAKDSADASPKDLALDPKALGKAQPKQLREGFLNGNKVIKLSSGYRMKTAINSDSGTAEEAKLFGFSYLPAGSRLIARITAKEASDLNDICEVFNGRQIRIGRSRRNEFGRANARLLEDTTAETTSKQSKSFCILAETDLALVDGNGFPTTSSQAIAKALDLPDGWKLDPERSFIRTRRYSPWNDFRKSFDPERLVIVKGSVLSVSGNSEIPAPSNRVGLHQGEGLGRITWEIPAVPADLILKVAPNTVKASSELKPDPAHLVVHRYQRSGSDAEALKLGQQWSNNWQSFRASLGSSQWSRLRSAAARASCPIALADSLNDKTNGIFHHGRMAQKWNKEKGRNVTLASAILNALKDETIDTDLRLAACREAARLTAACVANKKNKN